MPRTTKFNPQSLRTAPKSVRGPLTTGLAKAAKRVDATDDGKFTILRDVSLITRGEAGGHGKWIDSPFLDQVAAGLGSPADKGVKARFTHPGLSADGLGNWLGRVKASKGHVGDKVLGDLWISSSANIGPNFDGESIGDYLADRAEEDPESMGLSIVFFRDFAAELDLLLEHGGKLLGYDRSEVAHIPPERLEDYGVLDLSEFESPDPDNTENLIHFRLAELRAADLVDEPAANPDGMFSSESNQFAEAADAALAYALGLSEDCPESDLLPVHPERLRAFATRFFSNRGLDPTEFFAMPNLPPKAQPQPTGQDFLNAFGDEGAMYFAKGLSFEEATAKFNAGLKERIESLEKEKGTLAEQLAEAEKSAKTVEELTAANAELAKQVEGLSSENEALSKRLGVARKGLGEETPAGDGNPGGGKGSSGQPGGARFARFSGSAKQRAEAN